MSFLLLFLGFTGSPPFPIATGATACFGLATVTLRELAVVLEVFPVLVPALEVLPLVLLVPPTLEVEISIMSSCLNELPFDPFPPC